VTDGPLAGCRILVTRPSSQAATLCEAIRAAGGEPVSFPVLRIVPRSAAGVAADLAAVPRPDVAIFVSRNAVEHGLAHVRDAGATLAAIGPATADAIRAAGARVDVVPANGADSERLLAEPAFADVSGRNVLIVRGETGRERLADSLRARGATVHYLPVYRREPTALPAGEVDAVASALGRGDLDFVVVLSVETMQNLLALLPAPGDDLLRQSTLVAPGERVIQGACELVPGMATCRASGPGAGDIVRAMIDHRLTGQNQ
jgi:uroporphyrinogen-III synthase